MIYESNNFDRSQINGSINLINGNGTATFELKNLEYDEDGVFVLEISWVGVTVEVKGESKHLF